ncbi:MAG: acetyl-CoA hydrolase/transferase C-terminal domain-containing protein [Promethearchaeota archaeon]
MLNFSVVHYVITEHGIVNLRGKTIRQRSKALINIAHPDFRAQLEKDSYKIGFKK